MKDAHRNIWNEQQKTLQNILLRPDKHKEAIELCLTQHAMTHSSKMAKSRLWSFEDELLNDMIEETFRRIPRGSIHSIAWHLFHATRIEDITMNLLVVDGRQIVNSGGWFKKMKIAVRDTSNTMNEEEVKILSSAIDIEAFREYRLAVGRTTREIIKRLTSESLKRKVEPSRLQRVMSEGAVVDEAHWLIEYWGKRTIAGLLLMPATRHNFVHLNKAAQIKEKNNKK